VIHGPKPVCQLTTTIEVENFPKLQGNVTELVEAIRSQSESFGTKYEFAKIVECDLKQNPKRFISSEPVGYLAKSVIIATGATAKYLGLPNEEKLKTKGVYAYSVCNGHLFKNETVVVIRDGDADIEESLFLSRICSK
jgi:thioredoxin reductase (NADPH)